MELVYKVGDRPPIGKVIVFALQQLLAILAATIAVPAVINSSMPEGFIPMSQSAALFGAGAGTIVYLLFTKFKSPVFLGSSFAFLGSMATAFAGAATASLGYLGLIIGAAFAGLVYVIIALVVKFAGVNWINKIMPPVVIGPTVAIIGLSLAGNAIGDLMKGNVVKTQMLCSPYLALLCGLVTLAVTIVCSVYGKKTMKLIPFIIGIAAGYALAAIFTGIGFAADVDALKIIDFSKFQNIEWYPKNFAFINAFDGNYGNANIGQYIGTIAVAYVPVAFVVFAEHIADHKNLSSVIGSDLLAEPGLQRTLLGDGIGSVAGALFGGCPNTTYGEAVGPFVTFLATIPSCVMGGVCMALYGFIAVSGLKMLKPVDLNDSRNLFTASVILIAGIGGLQIKIGEVTVTSVACALILGILTNLLCGIGRKKKQQDVAETTATVDSDDENAAE